MQTSTLIHNLFKAFNDHKLVYCHWKSNEHLDASFKGQTDFDVLFEGSQRKLIKDIFTQNGFFLFTAPYNRQYSEIEDYIAIDNELNSVIHFHTHYQLKIGSSGLKQYRYAIEDKIFSSITYSDTYGCYLIDPAIEFTLLILRLSLKIKKDWQSGFITNKEIENSNRELQWLKERVSFEALFKVIEELKIPYSRERVFDIYQNGFQFDPLIALSLKKENIPALQKKKAFALAIEKYSKILYFQYGRIARKSGLSYVAKQRTKKNDGFCIAILGSDGSGKSTQLKELQAIFSKKIDVATFYLGSNKGSKSKVRKVLENIHSKKIVLSNKLLRDVIVLLIAFTAAFEKTNRINKAYKLKKKGVLIIFDRFPQNETYGYNDGPLLKKMTNSKNIIFRKLGEFEKKLYTPPLIKYPNVIFKLIAKPELLAERRNMTIEEISKKQGSIIALSYNNSPKIVTIDANQKIEAVTSDILKEIQFWLK